MYILHAKIRVVKTSPECYSCGILCHTILDIIEIIPASALTCIGCGFHTVKLKWSRFRPDVAQSVGRGIALLFYDYCSRQGWVVSSTLRPHFIPGKTRYPFYRRLGGPQGRSGRAENLVPTGIRSQTVQPIVSRYTDWATGPTAASTL